MSLSPRWRKRIRTAALAFAGVVALLFVLVQFQQYLLRWRAERLLSDIRTIQMGKSTWADAQQLMYRWGKWGRYEGTCAAERCSYQIELDERLSSSLVGCCRKLLVIYYIFGGRDAAVVARFDVIQGQIWAKDFVLVMGVFEGTLPDDDREYMLSGSATTRWRVRDFRWQNPRHPEYVVDRPDACTGGCEEINARYTPFADPVEVNQLMSFSLDCITRLVTCRHREDIMPSVSRQMAEEKLQFDAALKAGYRPYDWCVSDPAFLGRDRANVALARVVAITQNEYEEEGRFDLHLELVSRLKRASFWKEGTVRETNVSRVIVDPVRQGSQPAQLGQTLLLAFETPTMAESRPYLDLTPCDLLLPTPENLTAVKRGIAEDFFPEERLVWP